MFVLPSREEPWGLVVNEAMNAGCAVVLSEDVGCQPDLVTPGVEGAVFPAGDIRRLAEVLTEVLSPPATAAAMGERARARIRGWSFEQDVEGLRQALAFVTRRRA